MLNKQLVSIYICVSFFSLIFQKIGMLQSYSIIFLVISGGFLCLGCMNLFRERLQFNKSVFELLVSLTILLLMHCIYTVFISNFHSLGATIKVIIFTSLVIISTSFSDHVKTIKLIGRGFILFSIVSSLFGICLLILGQPTFLGGHRVLIFNGLYQFADGTYPFYRISGLFDNANSAGIIALFGIIALDKNEHSDKSAKFFIIINILFIFLTGSRTVLILMVLYFILSKSRSVNVSSLLKIIAILVPLAFLIIHKFYSSGVDLNAYLDSRMNDGLSSRDIAWGYLYDWFVSNPFGIGLDYADYRLLNDVKLGFGSHSGHFALITEVGIVLYILLMSTLFFFGMKNFIRRKLIDNPYIVYIPLIIFVHQFIERGIFQITYHYYLLLIVLVLGLLKEKRNEYTSDYVS